MIFTEYTIKNIEETIKELGTSREGLTKKACSLALKKYGLNEEKIAKVSVWNIILRQFKSPFTYLLIIAAIVSILIGQVVDCIAILSFIAINLVIGFFQEYRAEKAVFLLNKFATLKVRVIRDSREELIDKKLLVPGDIVLLETGDMVCADMRVISLKNFLVNESALTGESIPVSKVNIVMDSETKEIFGARNIIFSGSSVVSGKAHAVVIATGKDTVFGSVVKSVSGIKRESTYEKSVLYFCRLIMRIVSVTIIIIFIINILLKGPNINKFFELLLFSVALIVSILPEALPAVITFSLSRGSLRMAKDNVVVKRLSAIEDLGNIDVLCTDKTGTLTQNKMVLEETISSDKRKCFLYGILGGVFTGISNSYVQINNKILNPFDHALRQRSSEEILREAGKYKIIADMPFDSYRMQSAFLIQSPRNEKFIIVRGSSDSVIKSCSKFSGNFDKREIKDDIAKEGEDGKRVMAVAFKRVERNKNELKIQDEKGLTFLGYFVFSDPIKNTAKEAISLSKKLGIKIKIITGDSKEVAGYIAHLTNLSSSSKDIISGEELASLSAEEFIDACEEKSVFARISPDVKHNIIKALQIKHEVGFIGEGINDAPALKTADVGIAVMGASDIAREAADVVLLEKDLRVIVKGINDGRKIFSNINKYIKSSLASNFGNFYSIAVISLFVNFLPMLPVQILLVNILSDFPLISIATDSVDVDELKKPKAYQLHMVLPLIISLALVSTVFDFIFFSIFYKYEPASIQTLWFIESILTELLLIFVIRTRGLFYKAKKPSIWLASLVLIDAIIVVALPFTWIGHEWFHFITPAIVPLLIVFLLNIFYFISSEIVKLIYFHYWKPTRSVIS